MKTTIVHLPLHQFSSHSACMKKCYVVGHTKHYYLGQERVATGLGEGGWMSAVKPFEQDEAYTLIRPFFLHFNTDLPCEKYPETQNIDLSERQVQELQYSCHPACLTRLGLAFKPDYLLECIGSNMSTSGEATELFFTHNNHLGSASWITDKTATPVQYIHYAPYGELLANQAPYSYDERYKFTGKERDAESGYDFFGARFLAHQLGIWTRPDPLLNDYLDVTPYMYCEGNPIKFVDPDGKWAQMVVGAVASAVADAAIQVGSNMLEGQSFSNAVRNINGKQVLGSAIAGAIGVGIVSKVSQAAKIYKLGKASTALAKTITSPAGDVAGSVASQIITNDDHNVKAEQIRDDVLAGAIGSAVGDAARSYIKSSSGYKSALKRLNRAERMAENSGKASRAQALQEAESIVENYGAARSQALSSTVSKAVNAKSTNEVQ